jgi:nicotinamidase-related amidase
LPPFYDPARVGEVWRVPYQERAAQARQWAEQHGIRPAGEDRFKVTLVAIDVQNTFCIPGFELFVAGRSGTGAVDDNRRLCEFIYRNLPRITQVTATLDTHLCMQIFHPLMLVDAQGEHPAPYTLVTHQDIVEGRWRFNPALAKELGVDPQYGQQHLLHYTDELKRRGKYDLTIWPYHAMLGGIGHALVSSLEEAIFFHTIARQSQPDIIIKGENPLTEHYSALGPEVLEGPDGKSIAHKDAAFIQKVIESDAMVVAGQAKSHCVAWTVADLLEDILAHDPRLSQKVYLLEDCTSPVVVPGSIDYTDQAAEAYRRFASAGMHPVRSSDPMESWPGLADRLNR